jgi:hypothetical protein
VYNGETPKRAFALVAGECCVSVASIYLTECKEWQDGFFHPRTPRDLGLTYQLGHFSGEECEFGRLNLPVKGFTVLHNNGIHVVDINFCGCPEAPRLADQLLDIGWYPATTKDPSTAATVSLLRHFHKLNLQARVTAYDFYNALLLLTNAAGLKKIPVRVYFQLV